MRWSAAVGGLVWILCGVSAAGGGGPLWILELLFLLAPLVLVPLAIGIVDPRVASPRLVLMAALAATASFFLARGPWAAALTGPWLLMTLVVGACGLRRGRSPERDAAAVAVTAAMLFLPVGGGWLVLSRLGASPMGFKEPIVLLTAVHFHFAAFTTLVLVGRAGRVLNVDSLGYRAILAGAIAGTPILAAGITLSRAVELVGAATLAVSLWAFAILGLTRVVPRASGPARALLAVSFLSLFPSMALALLYAWGRAFDPPIVALGHLAVIHAPLNALGFALCGLIGWTASPSPPTPVKAP